MFKVNGKVALVTGGANGIGLSHVKELLKNEVKGVVIADINTEKGEKESEELKKEFGKNRVLFVKTDVVDKKSFENAFEMTIQHFGNIDILINNAGVCNDLYWEKEIDINLVSFLDKAESFKGTVNGCFLGIEKYLRYFKQGEEAVILNTSSIVCAVLTNVLPVYTCTKLAVLGLTKEWGTSLHYERTKVKVLAICPGMTETTLVDNMKDVMFNEEYGQISETTEAEYQSSLQSPEFLAKEALNVIEKAPNGSFWIIDSSQPAYQYIISEIDAFKNNVLK